MRGATGNVLANVHDKYVYGCRNGGGPHADPLQITQYVQRLATIRAANRGKPVKLDIVANPALWQKFSRNLSSQKFPVRVRFVISGVDSNPMQADSNASYGQLIHSNFVSRIPPDNTSREDFTGLLCADLPTLLKLSVKYPSIGGFRSAPVTGTIIGFRDDTPVFVLD
jgi:hypothetical protein